MMIYPFFSFFPPYFIYLVVVVVVVAVVVVVVVGVFCSKSVWGGGGRGVAGGGGGHTRMAVGRLKCCTPCAVLNQECGLSVSNTVDPVHNLDPVWGWTFVDYRELTRYRVSTR